jgi:hypothetical protein
LQNHTLTQTRFYSGSKNKHCLNMQATCDVANRFIAVSCKHVESTNDAEAFDTGLKQVCSSQLYPYHWVGGVAYTLAESMLIPYPGSNLNIINRGMESFNHYQSQHCIAISQTFGIFLTRWGILWQSMRFYLKHMECELVRSPCWETGRSEFDSQALCFSLRLPREYHPTNSTRCALQ